MDATELTIVVTKREIEGTPNSVYHAAYKEVCGISHWHSRGADSAEPVVARAREVAAEAGYTTRAEYEMVEI